MSHLIISGIVTFCIFVYLLFLIVGWISFMHMMYTFVKFLVRKYLVIQRHKEGIPMSDLK